MVVETNSHQKQLFVMYHYFLNPQHLHLITVILMSFSIKKSGEVFQILLNEKHYKPTTTDIRKDSQDEVDHQVHNSCRRFNVCNQRAIHRRKQTA